MNTYEVFKYALNNLGETVLYSVNNPEKYWIINFGDNEKV